MTINKIITLIDFTGVSKLAVEHTAIIARQSVCMVTLLHIADISNKGREKEIKSDIRKFASHLEDQGVSFAIQVNYGNFFEVISESINALESDLIVIGTHGIKGIMQNFVSSNILRLIKLISIPALIVQGHSQVPQEGYTNMLIPMLEMNENKFLEKPIELFSSLFKTKLHLLAFYNPENKQSVTSKITDQASRYNSLGFETIIQMEETSVYKSSYSRSIIEYADIEEVEVLLLAFHEVKGNKNLNNEDMENILLNRFGKPVLCI
jgi:nucleotide-binding universal stress UspA family protein